MISLDMRIIVLQYYVVLSSKSFPTFLRNIPGRKNFYLEDGVNHILAVNVNHILADLTALVALGEENKLRN
jgi:hypothetical protein